MRLLLFLLSCLFCGKVCMCAEADGAVRISMGGVSAYSRSYSAPASAVSDTSFSIGASYSNLYFLPELGEAMIYANLPFKALGVSLFLSRFGCDEYNDTNFGAVLWRRFGVFGMGLRYEQGVHSHVGLDEPLFLFRITPGAQFMKNDHTIGIHASAVSLPDDVIKPLFCIYYQYLMRSRCELSAEFEYSVYGCAVGRLALECGIGDVFVLRGGLRVPDVRPSFGIGFRIRSVSVDFGADYTPNLGCRAGVDVKCIIGKRGERE